MKMEEVTVTNIEWEDSNVSSTLQFLLPETVYLPVNNISSVHTQVMRKLKRHYGVKPISFKVLDYK